MAHDKFLRLFPPPHYLAPAAVGLDISDRSVKFVRLNYGPAGLRLIDYGDEAVPAGAVEAGEIKQPEVLAKVLLALSRRARFRQVAVSLPEEEAYLVRLALPLMDEADVRGSLELQLEEHIPLAVADTVFDYEIVSRGAKLEVAVTALPKRIVAAYAGVVAAGGLVAEAMEIEAQAVVRAVVAQTSAAGDLVMVVDFGKTRTSFFVTRGRQVLWTSTVNNIGGEDITHALEKTLGTDYNTAERYKVERGFLPSAANRETFFAIVPLVSVLRDEINKQLSYWLTHQSATATSTNKIGRVILCGGQATLPGLVDYLNLSLGLPVALGNVWTNLFSLDEYIPSINLNQSLRYATSLGLALRRFHLTS
ncbi:MAG: pilus assembly protein PilM [Patescibacteria group bacterium]